MRFMLIVDKDINSRKELVKTFEDKYKITETENFLSAFEIIEKNSYPFSIILISICDADSVHKAILNDIKKLNSLISIPFIILSNGHITELEALKYGASDYILKPFQYDIIRLRVENVIDKFTTLKKLTENADNTVDENILKLINNMPIPYVLLKYDEKKTIYENGLKIKCCNKSYAKLYGYDFQDLMGTPFNEFNDEPTLIDLCKQTACNKNHDSSATTTIELEKDKRLYSINLYSPKVNYCSLIFNDVTNTKLIQKKYIDALVRENQLLSESNKERQRYEFIANHTNTAIFEWNFGDKYMQASGNLKSFNFYNDIGFESLYNIESIRGIHPDDVEPLLRPFISGILKGKTQVQTTLRVETNENSYIWCKIIGLCFYDESGKLIRFIATAKDANQEIEYLNRLKRDAEYDLLTGLYNRNRFYQKVSSMLFDNNEIKFSIICFDINRFKLVNSIFGRNEGDKLLIYTAQTLSESLNKCDNTVYGRFDADVFCVCLPTANLDEYIYIIENLLNDYNINFDVVVSLGIYNIVDKKLSVDIMCDKARLALSKIKGNYLLRHLSFNEEMNEILVNEQEIVNDMNKALLERQFVLHFQPNYQLSTYKVRAAEALVRWEHPTKGMIYPNSFIPLFERNGFIMKLDEYVWESVCIFLRRRLDENKNVIPISVNVSKVNIYNPKLADIVISLLDKYEIPPNLFQVEITESAYTDNKKTLIEVIKKWQAKGITVMMDDFGSGYSSLNMLKDISVDVLKIDLNFLDDNDGSGKGKSIMSSVIRMAKWLNMYVITEGIEKKEQADFLRNIGCEFGQGYFFAKPMPMSDFENLLENNENNIIVEYSNKNHEYDLIKNIWLSELKTNMIFNSITFAMGVYEVSNNKIEAICLNDGYFNLHGISRDNLSNVEIHILDWIVEEDRPKALKMFNEALIKGTVVEGSLRKRLPNGKTIYIKTAIKLIMGDSKSSVYFATLNDVTNEKLVERKLEETNLEMGMLLQTTPAIIVKFKYDSELTIIYANEFFYSVLGYTKESYIEQNGNKLEPIIPVSIYNEIITDFNEVIEKRGNKLFKKIKVLAKDGSYRHFISGNGFIYNGDMVKILSNNLDITDLVNTEEKLQRSTEQLKQHNLKLNEKYIRERQLREAVSANSLIFCEIDLVADVLLDGLEPQLLKAGVAIGDEGSVFLKKISESCIHPEDREAFEGVVNNLLRSYKSGIYNFKQELRLNLSNNGTFEWVEVTTTMFESEINGHICCTITGKDISAAKHYEKTLIDKLERDPLTGLYNSVSFKKAVTEHLKKHKSGVFYMLDIDDFKLINDKYGHRLGDNLIVSVSHAISDNLPANAIIARVGGDEYAAFICEDLSKTKAIEYAEAICKGVRNKAPDQDMLNSLTCSLGVSICGYNDVCSYDLLYANADKAMYLAKQSGKNKYHFYENPNIRKEVRILICDDRNIRRTLISRLLSDKYSVIETASGLTCLEKAHEYGSDISAIILDSTLPDLSVLSVLEELQKDAVLSKIPVIMITKVTDTELKRKATLFGATHFLDKPIESDLLLKYVEKIVDDANTLKLGLVL